MESSTPLPWYKTPVTWLVFGIPATAIVTGIAMITISIIYRDGLVVDDYYKQGLGINQILKRQNNAEDLQLSANLEISADAQTILVSLHSSDRFPLPQSLSLGLYHSTDVSSDQIMEMRQVTPGIFSTKLPLLPKGRWDIVLEQEEWRLSGSLLIPFSHQAHLKPG
ncbi:MAG: FixH family protein [Acidiferrobacterales bacterium]|nr:FixH family protein [Acidiferrobacterales bacterium]